MHKEESGSLTLRIDPDFKRRLRVEAAKRGFEMSELAREFIERGLDTLPALHHPATAEVAQTA